jgi:hypothetical protein|tara:strand:+ start:624 stop:1355 length:732 start_codon:yes stop_codon:yes gene_type:complete
MQGFWQSSPDLVAQLSVHALSWAFGCAVKNPSEKLVLLALANYCDSTGLCWPKVKTLCVDTSLSERTVRTALRRLDGDFIGVEKRRGKMGQQASSVYRLRLGLPAGSDSTLESKPEGNHCLSQQATIACIYKEEPSIEPSLYRSREQINEAAWREFVQHRKEIKRKLTPGAEKKNRLVLDGLPFDEQQEIVDQAIRSGWTGLFPLKKGGGNGENKQRLSAVDRVRIAGDQRAAKRAAAAGAGD